MKSAAEADVAKVFEEALRANGGAFFGQLRHRGTGNDPPDCEAIARDAGAWELRLQSWLIQRLLPCAQRPSLR